MQNVLGKVTMDGTYTNNKAPKSRGGVLAVNRFYNGGSLLMKGTYRNNAAGTTGGPCL